MNISGIGTFTGTEAANTANFSKQNSELASFKQMVDEASEVSDSSSIQAPAKQTIDRTSKLYEKSQELETFFMKIVLSSMRATVSKSSLSGEENSYASKMYEDMMYDEFATAMTKNAGFGLADQVYEQLAKSNEH
jgi:flagellar protein FlgJ